MKNTYVKPEMQVEEFLANQYVAACGKRPDGKYIFTCDAPAGTLYYYKDNGDKKKLGSYNPCTAKHVTDGPGNYKNGFVDRNKNGKEDEGEGVLVWIQYSWWGDVDNAHASASLTQGEVEVVNS